MVVTRSPCLGGPRNAKQEGSDPPTRLGRVGIGVSSAALGQALAALQTIGLLPLFLHSWGADTYGRWCALTAFTSYLALLDLGGQNYIGNTLAMDAAKGAWEDFGRKLSQGVSLFLALGVGAFFLVMSLILLGLHFTVPLLGRSLRPWEGVVAASQAANFLLLTIPGGVYATLYRAVGRFARGAMIGNVFRLVSMGVSTVLLLSSVTPPIYAVWMLAMSAALTAYLVFDSRRIIPASRRIRIGWSPARQGRLTFAKGAWHFWLIAVAQAINQQGIVLLIAKLLKPEAVAVYATHRTLASIPGFIGAFVQGPVLPELSSLWARKQLEDVRRWALVAIRVVVLMTIVAALVVWVAAPEIYPIWTGKQLSVQSGLLGILLAQAMLAAASSTSSWSMLAANQHRTLVRWWLANAVVTLAVGASLGTKFGLIGAAAGGLLGDLSCGVLIFPGLVSGFLSLPKSIVYREVLNSLIPALPGIALVLLVKKVWSGWWSMFALSTLLVILAYPVTYSLLGKRDTYRLLEMLGFRRLRNA